MFYTNLQALCQQKQITPAVVARDLRLSSGLPTFWKKGSIPKPDTLQKIADYFSVTVNDLLSDTPPAPSKLHREPGDKIPLLSSVGAGIPLEAISTFDQDDPDSWEEISQLDASRGEYFYFNLTQRKNGHFGPSCALRGLSEIPLDQRIENLPDAPPGFLCLPP